MNFLSTIAFILLLLQGQPAGTGKVTGRVLRLGTNEPIAGAEVTLGRGPSRVPSVTTDNNGAFVISDIEPGAYMAMATKEGYAAQPYGARQPGLTGVSGVTGTALSELVTMITLESGTTVNDIVFHMTPAAIVGGRILGSSGEPLVGMQIELLATFYDANGRRPMNSLARTGTDDRGEFRLYNVEPGRYYLSASWTAFIMVLQVPGGPPAGFLPTNPGNKKYVATYYPGVSELARADVIDIKSGEQRTDLRFSMLTGSQQTFNVRGRFVIAATGEPPSVQRVMGAGVQLIPRNADFLNSLAASDPHLSVDGSFEIRDVQPGSYWLNVRSSPPMARPTDPSQPMVIPPFTIAAVPVEIVADNVEGLTVMMFPSTAVSGRVYTDDPPGLPARDLSTVPGWDRIRVQLNVVRIGTFPMNMMPDPAASALQPNGQFVSETVYVGEYRLTVSGLPPGVYVKKAELGGVDALSQTVYVAGAASPLMDIVISERTGQIRGLATSSDAKPQSGAQVVLVPEQRNKRPDLYRTVKSGADGQFAITGIVPGDYRLFAWDEFRRFEYFDPDLIRLSEAQGKTIHVEEDSKIDADITVIQQPK